MGATRLLVANRGEIAVRILRAAADLGWRTVAVHTPDDAASLHVRRADEARGLPGTGVAGYLDIDAVVAAARESGCDAVHPGYGFLAENAAFARRCAEAGLTFVGPPPELLELFGDKVAARDLARRCSVPVLAGTNGPTGVEEAAAFLEGLGPDGALMIKAVAGGGGRGMRVVTRPGDLPEAHARCRSEALGAFGNGDLYVEQLMPRARHVEVQVVGDGSGAVTQLGERECTIQRRHQKLVELAPSPTLSAERRGELLDAAVRLAGEVRYASLGTFEFLLDADPGAARGAGGWAFIEANPRLQVEHTVTEEVTGVDLVAAQLRLAMGATLADVGLTQAEVPAPRGHAIQVRVNTETLEADGTTKPAGGTLVAFDLPGGPGVRVDTYGYAGYTTNPRFDSLLAKVVGHSATPDFAAAAGRTGRALAELHVAGVPTNAALLRAVLQHPDFIAQRVDTTFLETHLDELRTAAAAFESAGAAITADPSAGGAAGVAARAGLAGARVDAADPLAVLAHGKSEPGAAVGQAGAPEGASAGIGGVVAPAQVAAFAPGPEGTVALSAPLQGTIVSFDVAEGDLVHVGQQMLVMEAMKMEHVVAATASGVVRMLAVQPGDTVFEGHALAWIEERDVDVESAGADEEIDLDVIRPDLAEVLARQALTLDAQRPDAVERRRRTQQRTARENIDDLCDEGSYVEYGSLVVAAQRRRRTLDDLIQRTQADGMVAGIGRVNGHLFEDDRAQCVVVSYDYTVLAGTQGTLNHLKKDRMFELAQRWRLPVVFFTEGGGGRPGDTDGRGAGLDCMAFAYWGELSGLVPLVGINSGRCFAGNAALLGCCDVIIATQNSSIGMGGPAMIEGGGLGVFRPEEVGPMSVQVPNGVVDVAVADEADAVAVAKRYLSYFQGPVTGWACADQRLLRRAIPENRLRSYDIRSVITTLADTDSVLELRPTFGIGMVTALVRVEGRPLGVIANNPMHLGGAIDSDGADKAARFMQLCDAYDVPLLFLSDTPGMMVGPEVEKTALVRHCSRMFVTSASLTVPFFTIILRKGYGLGTQAMAGGSYKAPFFTVAWPTGEFGGMGLEGAVKLGYRNELAALEDPDERRALYDEMVARMYEHGKALSTATLFEIDDVIDPADSRRLIVNALRSAPAPPDRRAREGKKRPCIDTW
jgi:acetyl/propionyl-CoA carboxylase alpha subunit/acetyl-CoA carboxylase carboxyltransferase component